jgi:DNA-directed RNA polymerase specialized sigma24 family protein
MAALAEVCVSEAESRDKRRVNHMDPETKVVHAKLEAWGAWAKDSEIRAYPSVSYLARWIEQGIHGASQQGRPPVSMPDEIAAIDAAVSRLNAVDKKAVQLYYLKWQPIEGHARTMHMRVRQYQNVLRRARWRLALFLNLL